MDNFYAKKAFSNKGVRPIAMVSQLLPLVARMHHIDELLWWLTNTMVEQFGIVSAQVWAVQAYSTQMVRSKARASSSQHPLQATQVLESGEVRVLVERMLRDQRSLQSTSVAGMFSQYQAALFIQQDCLYWSTYFMSKDVLLAPSQNNPERTEVATPAQMVFSFFTQQPLDSSDARAINFLLEQSIRIAISQKLFSKVPVKSTPASPLPLDSLIPEYIEFAEIEQGQNPFNYAVVIPEKLSRQMYSLIDGKKNINELTNLLRVSKKEAVEMLQSLLAKGYIRVREAGGGVVDISSFL